MIFDHMLGFYWSGARRRPVASPQQKAVGVEKRVASKFNHRVAGMTAIVVGVVFATLAASAAGMTRLAEQRNVIFDRLSTSDGLSQAAVTAITQDHHGFIWVGTQEGLNRYDGYDFETFYHLEDQPNSISHHFVWDVLEDTSGTLWVATDSGLNRFDTMTGGFEVFYLDKDAGSRRNSIYTLFEDSKRRLWIGTGRGISLRTPEGIFKHFSYDDSDVGVGSGSVRAVYETSDQRLWIGTETGGLYHFDEQSQQFVADTGADLADVRIRSLSEDREGNLWIATFDGGITLYNPKTGESKRLNYDKEDSNSLSANRVRVLLKDKQGDMWVGTDAGINLWQPGRNAFLRYTNDPTDIHSISDNTVFELFQDEGGVIWVGTFNGLSKFNATTETFPVFRSVANKPGSLGNNSIASFAEGADQNVWIGTFSGLGRWLAERGEFEHFTASDLGLNDDRVMSLEPRGDQLWVGTMTGGVNIIENDRVVEVFVHDPNDPTSISSNAISSLLQDSEGNMWLTTYGSGVNKYLGDGTFRRYPQSGKTGGEFSDLRAVDIVEDDEGHLWIATDGGGIVVLEPESGQTRIYRNDLEDPNSLSSNNIISLLLSDGVMWVGTRDRGLNRFNKETNDFERFTKTDGLSSDFVYGMLADDQGRIWLSGGKGLSVFDPEEGSFVTFDTTHGLQSDDFNSGAYLKLSDGSFLFGGNNGFNAFYPDRISGNKYMPPIKITRFSKFNERVSLDRPFYEINELELEYDDFVIGFEFAAMDYTAPEKNQFKYKLVGFDRDWIDANGNHQVTYTNLDAGDYTFRVIGANSDGVWNEQGASVNLVVNPPLWATWWSYLAYVLIALIVLNRVQKANELRMRREAEKRYSERLQLYIESLEEATDCVLIADANKHLMYANNAINSILGLSPAQAIGRSILSLLFSDSADASVARNGLRKEGRWHGEVQSRRGARYVTTEITIAAVHDDSDNETAFVSIARDVTDRKIVEAELEQHRMNLQQLVEERTVALQKEIAENKAVQRELANSLKEKELLLKEVHHRVKNNMQVISSLLNIQAETVGDDIFAGLLGESQQRIKSMSLIHENLYQSDNLLEIDFEDYINMLANSLHRFYSVPGVSIMMDIQVDNVSLDIETAVPCGLIINELISNSLKHGFKNREGRGVIYVHFRSAGCQYVLEIGDDGVGLPEDFSVESSSSMGMEIVSILTQQLDGRLQYQGDAGARFEITFPRKDKNDNQVAVSR